MSKEINCGNRWYRKGLRFSCLKCGRCCTGEPGYVWLTGEDIGKLSAALDMNRSGFLNEYCRNVSGRISLREFANGDCVFYDRESGCRIYRHRPYQCRLFPFWPQLLKSYKSWEREKSRCPGIGRGRLFTAEEIEKY